MPCGRIWPNSLLASHPGCWWACGLVKSDQAAIKTAKTELSYPSLVAPFDGVTGIRLLDVGNIIHATSTSAATQPSGADGNAVVVVTQVEPISVIFALATANIPDIQAAMASGPVQAIVFSQHDETQLDVGQVVDLTTQAEPHRSWAPLH